MKVGWLGFFTYKKGTGFFCLVLFLKKLKETFWSGRRMRIDSQTFIAKG